MFDLPTCLSKFLALGFSIRAVARRCAHEGVFPFYGNTGEMHTGRQLLRNVTTIDRSPRHLDEPSVIVEQLHRQAGEAAPRCPVEGSRRTGSTPLELTVVAPIRTFTPHNISG